MFFFPGLDANLSQLQALPHLRFNKDGNLLAVTTADNGFKILASPAGFRSLRVMETPGSETMRTPVDSSVIKAVMFLNFVLYFFLSLHPLSLQAFSVYDLW